MLLNFWRSASAVLSAGRCRFIDAVCVDQLHWQRAVLNASEELSRSRFCDRVA